MEIEGSRLIAAGRHDVWRALNSPGVLRASIPGCEAMSGSPETGFEARVRQKIGPITATFDVQLRLSDVVPGASCRITGEGQGGVAGFARGSARVALADAEGGTALTYSAEARVGGKLAQLGSRLIDGFARGMADKFFERFQAEVETRGGEAPAD
jgi:hypothetical protein